MAYNPPAFPQHGASFNYEGVQTGMTLRDWFAGQALTVIPKLAVIPKLGHGGSSQEIASAAYRIADAMLAARAK